MTSRVVIYTGHGMRDYYMPQRRFLYFFWINICAHFIDGAGARWKATAIAFQCSTSGKIKTVCK